MTEINVTSPTGLQEINRFDGLCLEAEIWDVIEERYGAGRVARALSALPRPALSSRYFFSSPSPAPSMPCRAALVQASIGAHQDCWMRANMPISFLASRAT